jgi:TetR/AcrR family transcriptional repressor of nem operon
MSKAENTRNFILQKTAAIFNRKGYAGTSLADLEEATGLTKGSIYGNFTNKDEVALAVFDYNLSRLSNGIDAALADGKTATGKLLNMANFYRLQFKHFVTEGGCPILNTAVEADDTHALLKEKVSGAIRAWKKKIESIIRKGIAAGEIRHTVNAGEFATIYIAMLEGGIMLSRATGNSSMLYHCIERLEKMINEELKA